MNETYKVIDVQDKVSGYPCFTIYTIEREPDGFKSFKDIGKQIGYNTKMQVSTIEAINKYKLMSGLKGDALETWSDILGID